MIKIAVHITEDMKINKHSIDSNKQYFIFHFSRTITTIRLNICITAGQMPTTVSNVNSVMCISATRTLTLDISKIAIKCISPVHSPCVRICIHSTNFACCSLCFIGAKSCSVSACYINYLYCCNSRHSSIFVFICFRAVFIDDYVNIIINVSCRFRKGGENEQIYKSCNQKKY